MSDAFSDDDRTALPACRGRRPHLRDFDEAGCKAATARHAMRADAPGGVEHLVPDHAVGPVDPAGVRQAGPAGRATTGPIWRRCESEQDIEAARSKSASCGTSPSTRDAEIWAGGRSKKTAGAGEETRRAGRPQDAGVGGLLRPRLEPQKAGTSSSGSSSRPKAYAQVSSRRSSWSSGCGRCGR